MSARALEFVIPGDLQAATGGYSYDRRMSAGLRTLGWRVAVHGLDGSFPHPTAAALAQAGDVFARLPQQSLVLVDGLAAGAMPQLLHKQAPRLRLMALVHHPLAAESGLAPDVALDLRRSERLALQAVRHVIVTSRATKHALDSYGLHPGRVSIAEPGTDAAPLARRRRGTTLKMLCVATLTPRKGHDLLFDALAPLAPLHWNLTCVGSLSRSPTTVDRLRAQLRRLGLDGRVRLAGEIDAEQLARLYEDSDLFVLPSHLEGYGMVIGEALAHGLPVVSTQVGAAGELVGTTAGLLVAPGDADLLRGALTRVLTEPGLVDRLAGGAAAIRGTMPDWQHACTVLSQILAAQLQDASDGGG